MFLKSGLWRHYFELIIGKGIRSSYRDDCKMNFAKFKELLDKEYDSICTYGLDAPLLKNGFVGATTDIKLTIHDTYKSILMQRGIWSIFTRLKHMLKCVKKKSLFRCKSVDVLWQSNFQKWLTEMLGIDMLLLFQGK